MSSAAQTRERLIRQGRIAFAAKGHDRVSLQRDVLEPAGVSTGSFYHQFKDKTELLLAVLTDGVAKGRLIVEHSMETRSDAPPVERVRERMAIWLETVEAGEDLFRIHQRERTNADERVRQLVAEARRQNYAPLADRLASGGPWLSGDFDSDRAAQLVTGVMSAAIADYLELPKRQRKLEREHLAKAMAEFIVGGISGMAGMTHHSGATTA